MICSNNHRYTLAPLNPHHPVA